MKKLCLILSMLLVLSATGCNNAKTKANAQGETVGAATLVSPDIAAGMIAADAKAEQTATEKTANTIPDKYKNKEIVEQPMQTDIMVAPTLENAIKESSEAVIGRAVGFENLEMGQLPWTAINVKVDRSLSKGIDDGDTIQILNFGGYISLRQHLGDSLYAHGNTMTEEEIDNTVLHITCEQSGLPETGEQYVFFLTERVMEDKPRYELTFGDYGFLLINEDGTLSKRPALEEKSVITMQELESGMSNLGAKYRHKDEVEKIKQ